MNQVVRRLYLAEAEASALIAAQAGAAVEPLGEGLLIAFGPGRYVNRAMGVGPDLEDRDLDTIDDFYTSRGLPPSIQLSSWASEATLERLSSRGYRPEWFRSVLAAALPRPGPSPATTGGIEIVEVGEHNVEAWLAVLADGNEIPTPAGQAISNEFARAANAVSGSTDFLALIDGHPAGAGSLQVASRVGLLGGAATVPTYRNRGVQSALLLRRIDLAATLGCDLVSSTALTPSQSSRNLQRQGLRLMDTHLAVTVIPTNQPAG